jgi:uncharacterized membrane protein YoaK (UPF0700 family)
MTAKQAPTTVPGQHRQVLVALLAMTAGATDAVTFLGLGGVFASVMTANMVLLGLSAAERSGSLAAHSATAFAGYVAGALAASHFVDRDAPPGSGQPRPLSAVLAAEFVVLAGFTAGWEWTAGRPGGAAQLALLGTAALAMGGQSVAVIAMRMPGVSATYMTGMLTGILGDLATAGRAGVGYRLALLGMLVAGAIASGLAFSQEPRLVPIVFLCPLAGAIALARLRPPITTTRI